MFFDLKKILKKYKIPWTTESILLCINAIRNIGKTTSAWDFFLPMTDEHNKIAYIRNKDTQLKQAQADFNAFYKGKYQASGGLLYSLIEIVEKDKEGNDVIRYTRDKHIGYFGAVSTYINMKSIRAANLRWIFHDEYNEESLAKGQYKKWINLHKTLTRFNKVLTIMLGNRDEPNNEYMVSWQILPELDTYKKDRFIQFSKRGYFLEMGSDQFKALDNDSTLTNELSQFNQDTKRYSEGGYINHHSLKVVPYNLIIKETFYPLFMLASGGEVYAFGEFFKNDGLRYFAICGDFHAVESSKMLNLAMYSLDSLSFQIEKSKIMKQENIRKMLTALLFEHKKGTLYYDSFDIYNEITLKMELVKFN